MAQFQVILINRQRNSFGKVILFHQMRRFLHIVRKKIFLHHKIHKATSEFTWLIVDLLIMRLQLIEESWIHRFMEEPNTIIALFNIKIYCCTCMDMCMLEVDLPGNFLRLSQSKWSVDNKPRKSLRRGVRIFFFGEKLGKQVENRVETFYSVMNKFLLYSSHLFYFFHHFEKRYWKLNRQNKLMTYK